MVSHSCRVNVKDDARQKHKNIQVTLAFPLGESVTDAHAYNCLPICATNMPFPLQADFILSASREGLDESHSQWNEMLFQALAKSFLLAIKRFNATPQLTYTWLRFLPVNPATDQFRKLAALVQSKLKQERVPLTQSGTLCLPPNAFHVPRTWRDDSGEPFVEGESLKTPNISTLYQEEDLSRLYWLGCRSSDRATLFTRFRNWIMNDSGAATFHSEPIDRMSCFAKALEDYTISELELLPIIPVKGGLWVTAKGDVLFFPRNTNDDSKAFDMPRGLPKVQVVMANYVFSEQLRRFYQKLGVNQGSVLEICKMIEEAHAGPKAPSYDPVVLMEQAIYLFQASEANLYVPYHFPLKQLWLCTEGGAPSLSRFVYQPLSFVQPAVLEYVGNDPNTRQLMHAAYLTGIAPASQRSLSRWLLEHWKVFTWLRICKVSDQGNPTAERATEFQALMSRGDSKAFLALLTDSWAQNFGSSTSPAFVANFSTLKARWASNSNEQMMLSDTFLPTKEIKTLAGDGVPYLQVADPQAAKWQMLKHLNVTTTASNSDPKFWLACLRSLLNGQPRVKAVFAEYERLTAISMQYSTLIRSVVEKSTQSSLLTMF